MQSGSTWILKNIFLQMFASTPRHMSGQWKECWAPVTQCDQAIHGYMCWRPGSRNDRCWGAKRVNPALREPKTEDAGIKIPSWESLPRCSVGQGVGQSTGHRAEGTWRRAEDTCKRIPSWEGKGVGQKDRLGTMFPHFVWHKTCTTSRFLIYTS